MRAVQHDVYTGRALVCGHELQGVSAVTAVGELHGVLGQAGDVHSEAVAAFLALVALQHMRDCGQNMTTELLGILFALWVATDPEDET